MTAVHSADNTRRLRTAVRDTKPAGNIELPMCWNSWARMDSLMVDVSLERMRIAGFVEAGIGRTIVLDSSLSFRSLAHVLNRRSTHDSLPIAAVEDSDPAPCFLAVQTLHTQRCNTAAQDATATPFPVTLSDASPGTPSTPGATAYACMAFMPDCRAIGAVKSLIEGRLTSGCGIPPVEGGYGWYVLLSGTACWASEVVPMEC
jgi:hypothetical protein